MGNLSRQGTEEQHPLLLACESVDDEGRDGLERRVYVERRFIDGIGLGRQMDWMEPCDALGRGDRA